MRTIRHPVGYTLPILHDRLTQLVYDPDTDTTTPTAWDLNDPDIDHVQLVLTDEAGTEVLSVTMTRAAGATGDISYAWDGADVDTAMRVVAIEEVHHVGGGVEAAPAFIIDFYDPLAAPSTADSPLCQPWIDYSELVCAASADVELYAQVASELLYVATGYQFTGVCEITVRPCPGLCGCMVDWCAECQTPCNTARLFEPVVSITSVDIAGEPLDPAAYRLFNRQLLQRIDGGVWPAQNYAVAPGEEGTWSVTYLAGSAPPQLGILAARDAACYLASLYDGEVCDLPAHIRSLGRQGVNQVFDEKTTAVLALPTVKMFLDAYPGTAQVWYPDQQPLPTEVL